MLKKFLAILLTFIFATNFLSVSAKTAEEKAAEKQANKEFKLQQKREKELAKIARRTNILKVEQWAEGGDVQAQMILSYAYSTGQRVDRNKKIAAQWQDKVAAGNEDLVKNFIPLEYLYTKVKLPRLYGLAACRSQIGQYVPQNFDDALRWAELGASEFDTLSFAILGSAYYTGRGVRQDYKKALEFLKKAGDEQIALALLSDAYAKGNGVDKDLEKSKFYADYSKSVVQPKIDKQREKNQKKLDKQLEKEKKKEAQLEKEKQKQKEKKEKAANKPTTEQKPTDDNKPTTEQKPADDIKPTTEEKPVDANKPTTEEKPVDDNKPSTE
ncbi:MAG: sel1 repeat family protein, partial [Selenomonadaceae bacterium]|nr:sel1 repeat family protein [Selenomonadaceae bacterium]